METRLRLNPGQNGTKKLVKQYGDRLICVRYLYDRERRKRYKIVELIVEEVPWDPESSRRVGKPERALDDMVGVRIDYAEGNLRELVKTAGGIWRPKQKLWELSYAKVVALGIEDRVIKG